jgi:outer membrane protein
MTNMNQLFFRVLLSAASFLMLMQQGWAQAPMGSAPAQSPLTLSDAVAIALKNSLGIRIANNNVRIAGIYNSFGYAGGLPVVTAGGSDVETSSNVRQSFTDPTQNKNVHNAVSNNLSGNVNASMLLYNGERVTTEKRRLGAVETQSRQVLSSRALAIVYTITLKYYDIIRQQGYARTLQASIDASRQRLEIVKSQQSVGVANNADLFQSQVDLNTQLQNLQAQQLVVDQGKTDLLSLLTLNPDSSIVVTDTILVERGITLETILSGVHTNPDIAAANEQIRINTYLEKETAAQRYPSLGLNAGFNFIHNSSGVSTTGVAILSNQNYGPFGGVGVAIPIFNGFIYKKQQEAAGININTAQLQRDTLMLNYTSNAVKNWQAYNNNLMQLETARANFDLSQKLLNLVVQRFQLRQATIVEVKNAQQSFEDAGFLLINVSFAAKSAEVTLKRYANQLMY